MFPVTNDTIVAVSSDWRASAVAVIRLSGPDSYTLVAEQVEDGPAVLEGVRGGVVRARVRYIGELTVPADLFCFRAPRSYTGQDLIELHVPGALPMVRRVAEALLVSGARRALPGEFTARAYLNGKLGAEQVSAVQALVTSSNASTMRHAARRLREQQQQTEDASYAAIVDLLSRLEAGIDFVEEEDVAFISASEILAAIDGVRQRLADAATVASAWSDRPHVALVGLPNAGKSTLFNALLGYERALVAPVLGTTRDVLSAEVNWEGVLLILQDCAGLGHTPDELEQAAHYATEAAADRADVILWVHEAAQPFSEMELAALRRLPTERVILVRSQCDRGVAEQELPAAGAYLDVSALAGLGLEPLQREVVARVARGGAATGGLDDAARLQADEALHRAREIAQADSTLARADELALELRMAVEILGGQGGGAVVEAVLGRIYHTFCVGK